MRTPPNPLQTGNIPDMTEIEALFAIADETRLRSVRALARLRLKMLLYHARMARRAARKAQK